MNKKEFKKWSEVNLMLIVCGIVLFLSYIIIYIILKAGTVCATSQPATY